MLTVMTQRSYYLSTLQKVQAASSLFIPLLLILTRLALKIIVFYLFEASRTNPSYISPFKGEILGVKLTMPESPPFSRRGAGVVVRMTHANPYYYCGPFTTTPI